MTNPQEFELQVLCHVREWLPRLTLRNSDWGIVSFVSVGLEGWFPQTGVVVQFMTMARLGERFGVRVPAWDDAPDLAIDWRPGPRASVVLANVLERIETSGPSRRRPTDTVHWLE